ncbi:uncharacterized protein G2W53_029711 [Senna tora]|uniref:Uncharacterized protein n=1 Tax=Senna tora TaxID=362788 RepID=A0A834T5N4_9FABA|nr:uncharacterized protein G2W53_029711 [Senna tora]
MVLIVEAVKVKTTTSTTSHSIFSSKIEGFQEHTRSCKGECEEHFTKEKKMEAFELHAQLEGDSVSEHWGVKESQPSVAHSDELLQQRWAVSGGDESRRHSSNLFLLRSPLTFARDLRGRKKKSGRGEDEGTKKT